MEEGVLVTRLKLRFYIQSPNIKLASLLTALGAVRSLEKGKKLGPWRAHRELENLVTV